MTTFCRFRTTILRTVGRRGGGATDAIGLLAPLLNSSLDLGLDLRVQALLQQLLVLGRPSPSNNSVGRRGVVGDLFRSLRPEFQRILLGQCEIVFLDIFHFGILFHGSFEA